MLFFGFWPVSSSSQCCLSRLTHQILHTNIGRARRQQSVPKISTDTVATNNVEIIITPAEFILKWLKAVTLNNLWILLCLWIVWRKQMNPSELHLRTGCTQFYSWNIFSKGHYFYCKKSPSSLGTKKESPFPPPDSSQLSCWNLIVLQKTWPVSLNSFIYFSSPFYVLLKGKANPEV